MWPLNALWDAVNAAHGLQWKSSALMCGLSGNVDHVCCIGALPIFVCKVLELCALIGGACSSDGGSMHRNALSAAPNNTSSMHFTVSVPHSATNCCRASASSFFEKSMEPFWSQPHVQLCTPQNSSALRSAGMTLGAKPAAAYAALSLACAHIHSALHATGAAPLDTDSMRSMSVAS